MSPESSRDRLPNANIIVGLLELAAVALLAVLCVAFGSEHRFREQLVSYGINYAFVLNAGEARLYLVSIIVGVPAAILLVDASVRLWKPGTTTLLSRAARHTRWTVLAFSILAVVLAELAAQLFGHAQFTDDERVYLWEARNLLEGSFTALRPQPPEFFHGAFWFMLPVGDDRWGSTYPPGAPALLALGLIVRHPHFPQLVCVGFIVWIAAKLAEDLWDEQTSIVTAALMATSPMLILVGATIHNSIPTTLFCLLSVWAAHRALRRGSVGYAALAGVGVGAALVCRPLDAVLACVIAGALLLGGLRRSTDRRKRVLGIVAALVCGLPFVALLLASQRAVTGDPFLAPFTVFTRIWPGAKVFGFGATTFGVNHTLDLALSEGVVTTARVDAWLLGWPLALVAPFLVLLGIGRDRGALVLLAAIGAHVVGYFFYVAPSVHTFGSYYSLSIVPFLVILVARFALALRDRLQTFETASVWPLRGLVALFVVAVLVFWSNELPWLAKTAAAINAPILAAERESKDQGPIVVFHRHMQQRKVDSWVFWPPLASGRMDEPVIWAGDWGLHNLDLLKTMPQRRPMMLKWTGDREATLIPWTPALARPGTENGPRGPVGPKPLVLPQPSDMLLPEASSWHSKDGVWEIVPDPTAKAP